MTNTYEKFHPICSTCGHVNSFESWEMICPVDKTYKTRKVLTFTESGYYVG